MWVTSPMLSTRTGTASTYTIGPPPHGGEIVVAEPGLFRVHLGEVTHWLILALATPAAADGRSGHGGRGRDGPIRR